MLRRRVVERLVQRRLDMMTLRVVALVLITVVAGAALGAAGTCFVAHLGSEDSASVREASGVSATGQTPGQVNVNTAASAATTTDIGAGQETNTETGVTTSEDDQAEAEGTSILDAVLNIEIPTEVHFDASVAILGQTGEIDP